MSLVEVNTFNQNQQPDILESKIIENLEIVDDFSKKRGLPKRKSDNQTFTTKKETMNFRIRFHIFIKDSLSVFDSLIRNLFLLEVSDL